jgi:hypothetical protein
MTGETKQRSPYVRVWLITMMLLNVLGILANIIRTGARTTDLPGATPGGFLLLTALSLVNLVFLVMIWRWRRWGFYALGLSTLLVVVINVFVGMPPIRSLIGMGSYFALYVLLRGGEEKSAWSQLD